MQTIDQRNSYDTAQYRRGRYEFGADRGDYVQREHLQENELKGIGGWLLWPAISLLVGSLTSVADVLAQPSVFTIGKTAAIIFGSYLFFSKRSLFVILWKIELGILILIAFFVPLIPIPGATMSTKLGISIVILAMTVPWMMYLSRSRRVANTFVN